MPFMQLKTNVAVTEQQETLLKTSFGSAITAIPGKSETWLMVGIEPQYTLYFQGSDAPAAGTARTFKTTCLKMDRKKYLVYETRYFFACIENKTSIFRN